MANGSQTQSHGFGTVHPLPSLLIISSMSFGPHLIYYQLVASLILLIVWFPSLKILFSYMTGVRDRGLASDVSHMESTNSTPLHMLVRWWTLVYSFMLSWLIPVLPSSNTWCQVLQSCLPCLASCVNLENMFVVLFLIVAIVVLCPLLV